MLLHGQVTDGMTLDHLVVQASAEVVIRIGLLRLLHDAHGQIWHKYSKEPSVLLALHHVSSGQKYLLAERTPASLAVPNRLSVSGHRRCYDLEVSVLWQSPIGFAALHDFGDMPSPLLRSCLLTILLSDTHVTYALWQLGVYLLRLYTTEGLPQSLCKAA